MATRKQGQKTEHNYCKHANNIRIQNRLLKNGIKELVQYISTYYKNGTRNRNRLH